MGFPKSSGALQFISHKLSEAVNEEFITTHDVFLNAADHAALLFTVSPSFVRFASTVIIAPSETFVALLVEFGDTTTRDILVKLKNDMFE